MKLEQKQEALISDFYNCLVQYETSERLFSVKFGFQANYAEYIDHY